MKTTLGEDQDPYQEKNPEILSQTTTRRRQNGSHPFDSAAKMAATRKFIGKPLYSGQIIRLCDF